MPFDLAHAYFGFGVIQKKIQLYLPPHIISFHVVDCFPMGLQPTSESLPDFIDSILCYFPFFHLVSCRWLMAVHVGLCPWQHARPLGAAQYGELIDLLAVVCRPAHSAGSV